MSGMVAWGQSLGLSHELIQGLVQLGYATPTPIQMAAAPVLLAKHDLLAKAATGSGKTVAYALPLLQIWHTDHTHTVGSPRTTHLLVLVPTRELALQVGEVLRSLAQHVRHRPKMVLAIGGVSINPQMMALRGGADVVVATPGRLLDLVAHNALRLGQLKHLVLDEADHLLGPGFIDETSRVLALLPRQRHTVMLSATFSQAVTDLAHTQLQAPSTIECALPQVDAALIVQSAYAVDEARRTALLRHLMTTENWPRVLVFVATRHTAERVADKLYRAGIFATAFHGELSQSARIQVLEEFKAKRWDVVVATDLAARGIDIPDMPVVINYDLPRSTDDYTHRIGRTGRAGASGQAVSFVTPNSQAHFRLIEKRQGLHLPRQTVPGFEVDDNTPEAALQSVDTSGNGGIKGKRPSKKDRLRELSNQAQRPSPGTGLFESDVALPP